MKILMAKNGASFVKTTSCCAIPFLCGYGFRIINLCGYGYDFLSIYNRPIF
jgi:hypothetical protein